MHGRTDYAAKKPEDEEQPNLRSESIRVQTSNRSILQRYIEEGVTDADVNFNIRGPRDAALDKIRLGDDIGARK